MVPAKFSVLSKMLNMRRYTDPDYMTEVSGELYGGAFRSDPSLIQEHIDQVKRPSLYGYLYQLLAIMNWSSLFWLRTITQLTLVLHGDDDPITPLENAAI